jgi:hypothetical protein
MRTIRSKKSRLMMLLESGGGRVDLGVAAREMYPGDQVELAVIKTMQLLGAYRKTDPEFKYRAQNKLIVCS